MYEIGTPETTRLRMWKAAANGRRLKNRLTDMTQPISFARGAPSLDIVDVEGLKAAALRAFEVIRPRSRRTGR